MADTVQYLMEQMIPELEDLEQKGYFSRAEIKKIVQKRQNFEYLLKRRTALKEDFYRYIEFEVKLEDLRRLRKQKLGIKGKKSLAETSIVRRIHFIYERAGRKFRSDLGLWMRWIEACKRYRSTKQLSKVVTKALQRHSTVPELWIEAARWEFETNNDIASARSLMQQGIRMCKKDETIWVQYYQLELLYALKLRLRRQVLGLDDGSAAGGEQPGEDSAAAVRAIMQGAIARVVYKNAIATLPGRLAFRARFLAVLRSFEYGFVEGLLDQIYDSIRQDFSQVEEAWDILARRQIEFPANRAGDRSEEAEAAAAERQLQEQQQEEEEDQPAEAQPEQRPSSTAGDGAPEPWDTDAHQAACGVYEEGLVAAPTPRMYQLFVTYLCGVLERMMGAGEAALQAAVGVAAQLFGVLQRAHSAGCSSAETYIIWADWAENVHQPKMALKAARKGCERFPSDVAMWGRRLQLELSLSATGVDTDPAAQRQQQEQVMATFSAALQATQPEQAAEVWLMAADTVPPASPEFGRLCDTFVVACVKTAKKAPSGGLGQVAARLVQKAREALGLDAARQLYGRLLAVPGPGGDLYRCAIRLEQDALQPSLSAEGAAAATATCSAAAASAPKAALKRITELYEAAVKVYGTTEADIWIDYAKWLMQCGKGSGQVYWRASKELADPDSFILQYRDAIKE